MLLLCTFECEMLQIFTYPKILIVLACQLDQFNFAQLIDQRVQRFLPLVVFLRIEQIELDQPIDILLAFPIFLADNPVD